MALVTRNLTPDTVVSDDYPLAQTPMLGGEIDVYATSKQARILGFIEMTGRSLSNFTFVNTPSDSTPGPIVAIVTNQLNSPDGAAQVNYADLVGVFAAPGYVADQGNSFPVGKAVELLGTFTSPTSTGKAVMTNGSRGDRIAIVELPALSDFNHVGCTKDKQLKYPTNTSKAIACQLNSARWVTKGRTEVGELTVNGLNHGPDTGLQRIRGLKCVAMMDGNKESAVKTFRAFAIDWTPALDGSDPEGDGESTLTARGMYTMLAILSAP